MKILIGSNNKGKIREMREMLAELGIDIVSPAELGLELDPDETGSTFEENALIKAQAFCEASGLPAMADDSGLCVEALNGAPGVYSARYGGDAVKSDRERCEYLLKNLENARDRRASFVSVIVCVFPDGGQISARGECHGEILSDMRGENGFGYDPVFYVPEIGQTMGEMPAETKNGISHRSKALAALKEKLKDMKG